MESQVLPGVPRYDQIVASLERLQLSTVQAKLLSTQPAERARWAASTAPAVMDLDLCLAAYVRQTTRFGQARVAITTTRELAAAVARHCQLVISCGLDKSATSEQEQSFEFLLCAASLDSLLAQLGFCRRVLSPLDRWATAWADDEAMRHDFQLRYSRAPPDVQAQYRNGRIIGAASAILGVVLIAAFAILLLEQGSALSLATLQDLDLLAAFVLAAAVVLLLAAVAVYARGLGSLSRFHAIALDATERAVRSEIAQPVVSRP